MPRDLHLSKMDLKMPASGDDGVDGYIEGD
jgi:hypothetical protein